MGISAAGARGIVALLERTRPGDPESGVAVIVAIASGKGGTGKTTVAVSLALSLADSDTPLSSGRGRPLLLDCDVEEPNAGLFLNFVAEERRKVVCPIPEVDLPSCNFCGRCADVCVFHAIAVVNERVVVFPELCHGCGSCAMVCPTGAILEVANVTGALERGRRGEIEIAQGRVNPGVAMPAPAIRQLKKWALSGDGRVNGDRPIIIDSPPGTSCPVVESIRGADFVLLVTEPTPFGEHDLRLAVEVARGQLGLPVGVIVNRDGTGFGGIDEYCRSAGVPVLMRIPRDRRIAEAYSDGVPLVRAFPEYMRRFQELYVKISTLQAEPQERPRS
jgi:MinD superfamily P-loop ATPase